MSNSILRAATCTRALLHKAYPGERFDDDRIFDQFLAEHEDSLVELASRADAIDVLSLLSDRAVDLVKNEGGEIGHSAASEADELVFNSAARQQSDLQMALVITGGVLGALTIACLPLIILSIRLGSTRMDNGKFEAKFFEGVPETAKDLVLGVLKRAAPFDTLAKHLHPSNDDQTSKDSDGETLPKD